MDTQGLQSREEILKHLEDLTGRKFASRDDVRQFVGQNIAEQNTKMARAARAWQAVKNTTLLVLLVLAFVQYYLIDVLKEIVAINGLTVFVPVTARDLRSAWELVSAFL